MLNDLSAPCRTISYRAGGHTADIKRHQVNQHPLHRHQQQCVRLHRLTLVLHGDTVNAISNMSNLQR